MKRLLLATVALISLGGLAALADYTVTQGTGSTVFAFTCFTTKICPAMTPTNSAGTEIGTSANPIQVTVANTGANATAIKTDGSASTQPVSGTVTANATLAAETTKVIGTVRVASGGVASGSFASGSIASGALASGSIASGAFSSGSIGSGALASGSIASGALASGSVASGAMVDLGAQADSACGTATGTCSLIALAKYLNTAAGLPLPAQTTNNVNIGAVMNAGSKYETVAASQTGQALGATGATGDYLSHCIINPVSTSPGVVTVFDNTSSAANNVIAFAGGVTSLPSLAPVTITVGAVSVNGAWKVTTGADAIVTCFGKFT